MFQKGNTFGLKGRPKGTVNKNTQNYLDFQLWFMQIFEDINKLDNAEKRLGYAMQMTDKLLSKVQNLPSTPEHSVDVAKAKEEMLNALETQPKPQEGNVEPNA